jgi:hypothetical protein
MCMISGPLSGRDRAGTLEPQRIRRDAVSQRLMLRVQPQSVGTKFAEEAREVA